MTKLHRTLIAEIWYMEDGSIVQAYPYPLPVPLDVMKLCQHLIKEVPYDKTITTPIQ
jgi:hypothetical protein